MKKMHNKVRTYFRILEILRDDSPPRAAHIIKSLKIADSTFYHIIKNLQNWGWVKKIGKEYAYYDYEDTDKIIKDYVRILEDRFLGTSVKREHVMRKKIIPDRHIKLEAIRLGIIYDDNFKKAVEIFRKKHKINRSLKDLGENIEIRGR